MAITRPYSDDDVAGMCNIWNEVVKDGIAFPQENPLGQDEAASFFAGQTCCGVATDESTGDVLGLFILHAKNVGRCGHIANASYAVSSTARGKHIGVLSKRAWMLRAMRVSAFCNSMRSSRLTYPRDTFMKAWASGD